MNEADELPPITVAHYAFVTKSALVAEASEALHTFAETDDVTVLERMLGDWTYRRAQQLAAIGDRALAVRPADPRLDAIERTHGDAVPDLAAFALAVAQCAGGAFPRNIGLGATLMAQLSPTARQRLEVLRAVGQYGSIHGPRKFETDPCACVVLSDTDVWLPPGVRLEQSVFDIWMATSGGCGAWRRKVGGALPVGMYGGPMTASRRASAAVAAWWPRTLAHDECVVSFVIARTAESPPFLGEE